ncbi:hypothetical protein C5688_13560 [Methylocystis sp. MitZ-2018]|nr:hypothetical protein C5688_13560 [Methylocystis sp. MitZ-2018]
MAKQLLAFALGERWIPGNDADSVEAVQIDGVASPISLEEAHAMGVDVKRVAWLDYTMSDGREMVRYADMSLGSRAKAEAGGFLIKPMSKSMRAAIDRDQARMAADDAAFAAKRKQKLDRRAATVEKPQTSGPPFEPEQTLSPYESALLNLDEARVRPQAARVLLEMHSDESSLPIHQAAAILAALPFETRQSIEVPLSYSHTAEDAAAHALLVRVTELRQQALSMRAARYGDANAKAEARKLSAALQDHRSSGANIVAALNAMGADMCPIADQARRVARAA